MAARLDTKSRKRILFLDSDINELLAKQRCALSEKRTKEALERLKRNLLIVDYMRVSKIKKMDNNKIDFIITIIKGACYTFVPLQVKSSETGLIEHKKAMRQMRKRGIKGMLSNIAAIIVDERNSIQDICKKIMNAIS